MTMTDAASPPPETPADAPPAPAGDTPRRISKPALLLLALALIIAIHGAFLLLLIGLLPSLAAYMADRTPKKSTFLCVFLCNFSGVMPYVLALGHAHIGDILVQVQDMPMWLVMFSSAALGWGIVWLVPLVVGLVLRFYYAHRITYLSHSNEKLAKDWGLL